MAAPEQRKLRWCACLVTGPQRRRTALCKFLCACNGYEEPTFSRVVNEETDLIAFAKHASNVATMSTPDLYTLTTDRADTYSVGWDRKTKKLDFGDATPYPKFYANRFLVMYSVWANCGPGIRFVESHDDSDHTAPKRDEKGRRRWYGYILVGSREFQKTALDFVYESEGMAMWFDRKVNRTTSICIFTFAFGLNHFPVETIYSLLLDSCTHMYNVSHVKHEFRGGELEFGAGGTPETNTFRFCSSKIENPLLYNSVLREVQPGKESVQHGNLFEIAPDLYYDWAVERVPKPVKEKKRKPPKMHWPQWDDLMNGTDDFTFDKEEWAKLEDGQLTIEQTMPQAKRIRKT